MDALLEAAPSVRRAVEKARAVARILRERDADAFGPRLHDARGGPLDGLVEGLRRDGDAAAAALVPPWRTGPVEGPIGRLEAIKRQRHGRAGLDLLRARALAA